MRRSKLSWTHRLLALLAFAGLLTLIAIIWFQAQFSSTSAASALYSPSFAHFGPGRSVVTNADTAFVNVLCYHRIAEKPNVYTVTTPELFRAQMKYLHDQNFHVLPLESVVDALRYGTSLPTKSVVLTFDDGFSSCLTEAYPVLKKYQFPATLFIYTRYIGAGKNALSWDDVKTMAADPLIEIGCHSLTHPNLAKWKPGETPAQHEAWLNGEIVGSKTEIEREIGQPVTAFAYPYGAYDQNALALVKTAGYTSAWTVDEAPVTTFPAKPAPGTSAVTLQRELIYRDDGLQGFTEKATSRALPLANPQPAPNRPADPESFVSVHIERPIQPGSLRLSLGLRRLPIQYDPGTGVLEYRPANSWRPGAYPMDLVAKDPAGHPLRAAWTFFVNPSTQ